ncbi:hypothetical protein BV25DRAFT_1766698, partial [Artomyces pyxidatus]
TLKRRASPTFEDRNVDTRKRLKEDIPMEDIEENPMAPALISGQELADDLEEELLCGCCSGLLYRPVIVYPCQHYFCGRQVQSLIYNGGSNCPACRSISTSVSPSRVLQVMLDVLLRADPSRGRTEREKQQADDVYRPGQLFRIPTPREPSPEPAIAQPTEYARPCPHCPPVNRYGWNCPQPVPDPAADPDHAWLVDDGSPPGHAYCGNCENLMALQAPSTTKCDMCQVSFCGIGVQGRCIAASIALAHPHGMSDVGDLIQSSEVYECFDGNTVEVEIMLDYLTAQRISPKHIYRDIVEHVQNQPRRFAPLIELDLFSDAHGVVAGPNPPIDSPRHRICRLCATEVLLYGLKEWWIRERQKGFLEASVTDRPDCPDGSGCHRQKEHGKTVALNHIVTPNDPEPTDPSVPDPEANVEAEERTPTPPPQLEDDT